MSKTVNVAFAKIAVAFVAIAMMFSVVAPASAQNLDEMSTADLIALINQLLGETEMAAGVDAAVCPYTWTRDLSMGSTGADVMALQQFLNSMPETQVAPAGSAGSAGMETQYYGPATGAAVANFQMKYRAEILTPIGLVNPTQYFGASSRAQANDLCIADVDMGGDDDDDMDDDDDDDNGGKTLGNGEGDIDSVTETASDDSNVEEGALGAIFAFEVEIDGDVEIDRIDMFLEVDDNTGVSNNADDYFTEAQLWVDGEEVASLDVDDWGDDDYTGNVTGATNDDEYRLRFSGLGLVYEDDDEPEFVLGLVGANNIDSADLGATWIAALADDGIRFVDGQGFTGEAPTSGFSESFDFDEEEMAELDLSESSDSPDATTLEVDADDETDDVEIFVFEIEEENGVDVVVEDIRVTLVTLSSTSAAINEDVVIASARLMNGSTELGSESVPASGIVDFENVDLEIEGDETVELSVEVTFEDTDDGSAYSDGTTVQVTAVTIQEAEDENGNDEGDMTISGSVSSEVHTLRESGFSIVLDSQSTSVIENNDTISSDDEGKFTIEFTVTAFGDDDLNLPFGVTRGTTSASDGISYQILDGDFNVINTGTTSVSLKADDSSIRETNSYEIGSGDEESFTLTVEYDPVTAGSYFVRISALNYAVDSDSATATVNQDVREQDIETEEELI